MTEPAALVLLRRELATFGRRRALYSGRVLILGVGMLCLSFARGPEGFDGRRYFEILAWIQTIFLLAVGPATAAGGIVDDAERGRLGILLLTRAGALGIGLSKLVSRVVVLLHYAVLAVPLFGAAYLLGGIGLDEVSSFACATLGSLLFVVALGAIVTTIGRKPLAGIVLTYLAILIPIPWIALATAGGGGMLPVAWPALALIAPGVGPGAAPQSVSTLALAGGLAWAALAVIAVTARVRPLALAGTSAGTRRGAGPRRWVTRNPVEWKECRRRSLRWMHVENWGPLGVLLAVVAACRIAGVDNDQTYGALGVFNSIATYLCFLAAMVAGSRAYVVEKEAGTLELLLATKMDERAIVRGKLMGFVRRIAPLWFATLIATLIARLLHQFFVLPGEALVVTVAGEIAGIALILLFYCVGAAVSLRARSRGGALIGAIAASVALYGVLSFIILRCFYLVVFRFFGAFPGSMLAMNVVMLILAYGLLGGLIARFAYCRVCRSLRRLGVRAG